MTVRTRLPGAPPPPLETDVETAGIDVLLDAAKRRERAKLDAAVPDPEHGLPDITEARHWSVKEVGLLMTWLMAGQNLSAVADELGRTEQSVKQKWNAIQKFVRGGLRAGKRGKA